MVYELYSVFDKVASVYSEPFLAVNEATAIRRFNWQMSQSSMVAGDCALYKVGEFDIDTGVNTAYSRSIADLKKNGINPYSVLSGMNSASTPSGAIASGSSAHSSSGVSNTTNAFATLVSSAFSLAKSIIKGQFDIDVAKIYKRG